MKGTNDELHTEPRGFVPPDKMGGLANQSDKQHTAAMNAAMRALAGHTHPPQIKGGASLGIGGAPTRATTIPHDAQGRKERPVASGVLDYFPDALVAVAHLSWKGNEQHNPGQPLHWARGKSGDEGDALIRHFLQRGTIDSDGVRHSAKVAWRALAMLQKEIEADGGEVA